MKDVEFIKYRKDIDGIRAVAVVSVLLFHSGLSLLPGGYVGVDIFFVISGYLITRIIYGERIRGTFSIINFYERRIRRIIPALYAVLVASIIATILISAPEQSEDLSASLIFTQLFSSNIFFWRELNYFAADSELRPLLHTWSLGVEEQFYILFPIFLAVVARWRKNIVILATLTLLVLSFAISVWGVAEAPRGAFFLLPSRAWELLFGSVLAIGAIPHLSSALLREGEAFLGAMLVVGALVLLGPETAFPGWAAVAPCLGAAMVIHAGERKITIVGRLLSGRVIVFVGLISYSLYLWHWPVLAFARQYYGGTILPHGWTFALGGLIFLLSWLSWRWVERPFRRHGSVLTRSGLFGSFAALSAVILGLGVYGAVGPGWPSALVNYAKPDIRGIEDYSLRSCFLDQTQPPAEWGGSGTCRIGTAQSPDTSGSTLLWGDSFAAHWRPGFAGALEPKHGSVIQLTAGGCPPVFGFDPKDQSHCLEFNRIAADVIAQQNISRVILAARWERYEGRLKIDDLRKTIESLQSEGVDVIVVNQSPVFTFIDPYEWQYRHPDQPPVLISRGPLVEQIGNLDLVDVIEPRDFLCGDTTCPYVHDGKYIYFDEGHFSSFGSRLAAAKLLMHIFPDNPAE